MSENTTNALEKTDTSNVKEIQPEVRNEELSVNDTLASNLLNNRKLSFKNNGVLPDNIETKESEKEEPSIDVTEDNNKPDEKERSGLLDLVNKESSEDKEPPVEYSEEVKKEIENYKKQVNDIKSNFHKSNIQNKLLNKKIEDLYNSGDIDEDIKNKLASKDEEVIPEENQSIYEWDELMDKASQDLNKRFEYTKDESIDKHADAFMYFLYSTPKDKGIEIMDYLKSLAKTDSVEKAVSEMLELGEHFYNDGMQDFFDNDKDVKKVISVYKDKLKASTSELEKIKKDNHLMKEELKKYKELNISASKDYKSSGMFSDGFIGGGVSALTRAKQKTYGK